MSAADQPRPALHFPPAPAVQQHGGEALASLRRARQHSTWVFWRLRCGGSICVKRKNQIMWQTGVGGPVTHHIEAIHQPERLQRRRVSSNWRRFARLSNSGRNGKGEVAERLHETPAGTNSCTEVEAVEAPAGWFARPARRRGRGGRRSGRRPAAARYYHVLGPGASAPPSPPYDAPAATGKVLASPLLQSSHLHWPAS